ncbi:MAG: hypothetical protein EXS02_03965 [Planctomycetes bacterium]|nr:hypothetical protein [Planctomycetota bacterium]
MRGRSRRLGDSLLVSATLPMHEPSVNEVPPVLSTAADALEQALQREWLLTDGLGGYACGTAADVATRRYHAWLCAVPPGRSERVRFLSCVDERLDTDNGEVCLLSAHWRNLPAPTISQLTAVFHAHPVPTWVFGHGEVAFERSLVMLPETRAILIRWRNLGKKTVRLRARPLLACEPADALMKERLVSTQMQRLQNAVSFQPDPLLPPLWMSQDAGGVFHADPCWYHDFQHDVDASRGYDAVADRWSPGILEIELAPGSACVAAFSVGAPVALTAQVFAKALALRVQRAQWANQVSSKLAAKLRHGVDDFFYRDESGRLGILAGFPWFGEWGRDAFISLPGLTLAAGRPERCVAVLRAALPFLRDGLLPNIYGVSPETSNYGSADAALWFALAVQRFHDSGQTKQVVRDMFGSSLIGIAEAYRRGTALLLRVDDEELLCAGSAKLNVTWMDAQLPSGPVTPRHGQPVELVAVWCSLLQHLAELYGGEWTERAERAGAAFVRRFWRADAQCLFDNVCDGKGDAAMRPNMVIAAALARSPLSMAQRSGVVAAVFGCLRTPFGLRTLAPMSAAYRGRYRGDVEARDEAYHQGTVWPWLSGFYVEAALRSAPDSQRKQVARELQAWLENLLPEADRICVDHISEVYDGDLPQTAGGTFAQAWNTGELIRAVAICADVEGRS